MKVGDSVQVLNPNLAPVKVGSIGTIFRVKTKDGYTIMTGNGEFEVLFPNNKTWLYHDYDLQLIGKESLAPTTKKLTLPTDSTERKNYSLFRGCLRYFPAALSGVARTSKLGNDKHNPGEEMHHARSKSMDHGDCVIRHLVDVEDLLAARSRGAEVNDQDILNEVDQMAWRALAFSQLLHEKLGAPLAPGAKLETKAESGKGK